MLRKSSAAIDTCLRVDLTFFIFNKDVTRPEKSITARPGKRAATFVLQIRAQLEL